MFKKKITIFYIASAIFILDRLSKYFILELSNSVEEFNIPVTSFLNFNLVWNNGIAFGLFSFNEQFYYNIITLIIIIITFVILFFEKNSVDTQDLECHSSAYYPAWNYWRVHTRDRFAADGSGRSIYEDVFDVGEKICK